MADEQKICKHPACSCAVDKDNDYCSASCQGAGGTATIDCDCGHPAC